MHIPVLLNEVISYLSPKEGDVFVDATFGNGGYTKALLSTPNTKVIAFDKDPDAIRRGQELSAVYNDRLFLVKDSFTQIKKHLAEINHPQVHGIVFDLGVSSFQIDEADRGFSFKHGGPLDMRMSKEGISAYDVVNTFTEEDLADIFYHYGEEKKSYRIAKAIVHDRKTKPFETTAELADLVKRVKGGFSQIHPATLVFQALRIFVNNELIEIKDVLSDLYDILFDGGKVIIVTFHSLEDRLVKNHFQKEMLQHKFKFLTKKPVTPSQEEILSNIRSRSSKLRAYQKVS